MKNFVLVVLAGLLVAGCTEKANTGEGVLVPLVNFSCQSSNCQVNATRTFYFYYTTSGCSRLDFGLAASGTATVSCSVSSGCSGGVSSWQIANGTSAIPAGNYDICGFGDMNNNWSGQSDIGDSSAKSEGVTVNATTTGFNLNTWINVTS